MGQFKSALLPTIDPAVAASFRSGQVPTFSLPLTGSVLAEGLPIVEITDPLSMRLIDGSEVVFIDGSIFDLIS